MLFLHSFCHHLGACDCGFRVLGSNVHGRHCCVTTRITTSRGPKITTPRGHNIMGMPFARSYQPERPSHWTSPYLSHQVCGKSLPAGNEFATHGANRGSCTLCSLHAGLSRGLRPRWSSSSSPLPVPRGHRSLTGRPAGAYSLHGPNKRRKLRFHCEPNKRRKLRYSPSAWLSCFHLTRS